MAGNPKNEERKSAEMRWRGSATLKKKFIVVMVINDRPSFNLQLLSRKKIISTLKTWQDDVMCQ